MPKCLHQTPYTMVMLGSTHKYWHDLPPLQNLGKMVIDFFGRWNCIFQQLLKQCIIKIGQRFQQLLTGQLILIRHVVGYRN